MRSWSWSTWTHSSSLQRSPRPSLAQGFPLALSLKDPWPRKIVTRIVGRMPFWKAWYRQWKTLIKTLVIFHYTPWIMEAQQKTYDGFLKIPRWLGGVIRHNKFSRFRSLLTYLALDHLRSTKSNTPPHLDWLVAEEMVIRGSRVRRLPGRKNRLHLLCSSQNVCKSMQMPVRQYAIAWYRRGIYCQFDLHTKKIHNTYPFVPKGGLPKASLLKRHGFYCRNKWITNKKQHKETCFCIHSMIPT